MNNFDVRTAINRNGVRKWQIAEKLGIADTTFSKKLRKELSRDEKDKIFKVIDELKRERRAK